MKPAGSGGRESQGARDAGLACLHGIAGWKRARIRAFLGPLPHFSDSGRALRFAAARGGTLGVWASRLTPELSAKAAEMGVSIAQIEDGFIRSVGLGAGLSLPWSITIDRECAHFDPRRPSDLETLLQAADFSDDMLEDARAAIALIRTAGLSKYNLGGEAFVRPAGNQRMVVAFGQVSDDRSMQLAGAGLSDPLDFLGAVRAAEPGAFLIYKPHPDVSAGLRAGALSPAQALRFADRIETQADSLALIEAADAVHVVSSLAGFEALLREKRVVTHGQPFYAGWGLTGDRAPLPRRSRRLELAQLAAGALLAYPLYLHPETLRPCDGLTAIRALTESRKHLRRNDHLWLGRLIAWGRRYGAKRHDARR